MSETCSFITEQIWIIGASGWLFKKKTLTHTLKFQIHYQRQSFTSATHLFCHKHKNAPCRCELHNTVQQPIPLGSSNWQQLHNLCHISIGFTNISLKDKAALQTLKCIITQWNANRHWNKLQSGSNM